MVQLLRIAAANPNERGPAGIMRLYQAEASGDIENVKFLLQNNVNSSITTNYGWAPLHWAANSGHADCVRELLKWKVDLNTLSDISTTPLDMAREMNQTHIIRILFDAGAKTAEEVLKKI